MRTILAALLIMGTTVVARAEQSYDEGDGGTWDCKKDPNVTINIGDGTFTFKGACKRIVVNGGENKITAEGVESITVNGNDNTITLAADKIALNGNDNKITYKAARTPKVQNLGERNVVAADKAADKPADKPVAKDKPADKPAADKPAAPPADAANVQDCAKTPTAAITSGEGTYKFVGPCTKIAVTGGENTISIESVTQLAVNGSKNTIDVGAADKIAVIGSDNKVTYKKGVSVAKPKTSAVGKNNKIEKIK